MATPPSSSKSKPRRLKKVCITLCSVSDDPSRVKITMKFAGAWKREDQSPLAHMSAAIIKAIGAEAKGAAIQEATLA